MNRIGERKKKLWFSILLNGLLLFVLFLLFSPKYETNDDMGILCMAGGIKNWCDPHLVYVNYVLGRVLTACYQWNSQIPWYPLIQYGILFTAFTAVTWVIWNRFEDGGIIWLIFLPVFAHEAYIRLQYTKTAGIVSAAGMLIGVLVILFLADQKAYTSEE